MSKIPNEFYLVLILDFEKGAIVVVKIVSRKLAKTENVYDIGVKKRP
ncbi:hypothetical protein CYANOKiyG1_51400 [Okeania sp. KiyG1]|nr:hypothetical protein CYANOKiyG1_51400 [Okeania sp. KiyG1]